MRKKLFILVIFLFLSNQIVLGKNDNSTKNVKSIQAKSDKRSGKVNNGREKRSLRETYIAHELGNEHQNAFAKYSKDEIDRNIADMNIIKETPFWGTRGRRDSSSESAEYINSNDVGYKDITCKTCSKYVRDFLPKEMKAQKASREESDEYSEYNPFWGNRGRRQEDHPFWGNRGRRSKFKWKSYDTIEDPPFWSSRWRRDDVEPFWGNRGRRDETDPFWGNRGRRDEMEPFWGNRGRRDENEPFWGNRGRRQETEPFWGTRGRREVEMPYWRKKEHGYWTADDTNPFWGIRGRRKFVLKENIIKAINNIGYDVENLARIRKNSESSFWHSRGRDNKLDHIFNSPLRNRVPYITPDESKTFPNKLSFRLSDTMNDDRMFAEEPHYILIERSSRSSGEDDPFFITRGKKYINGKLPKSIRDRRGAIEELVKSVRNDPYYIARGKKDTGHIKIGNLTILKDDLGKAKELICSTVDLLAIKNDDHKVKRDVNDSERDRRTILKKLADQLQMDPYFVSRGKKNDGADVNDEEIEEFINNVVYMCN